MRYILIVLLATKVAYGVDWLCTEESSQRIGRQIYACGIGEAKSEARARDAAFAAAEREFHRICDASDDCRGRAVTADPRRTECHAGKCYRLVVFTVESGHGKHRRAPAGPVAYLKKGMTPDEVISFMGKPQRAIGGETFFYEKNPKCEKGGDCFVQFSGKKRRVDRWEWVDPSYTEDTHGGDR